MDLKTQEQLVGGWKRLKSDPVRLIQKVFGVSTMWDGAREMVESTFRNRKTAVKAAHAMSKDWTAGLLVISWLLIHWKLGRVIVTAPTGRQVKDVIFAEVAKQYENLRRNFPEFPKDAITTTGLKFGPDCFAIGFTTKETNEMVGKFQGFHSPNMLIIISEAQAVDHSTYKQLRGLTTSVNSRIVELGNPLVPFGDFYEHCTQPHFGYNIIHLPASKSPNVIAGKEVIPGMVTKEWIEDFQKELGPGYEEDPEYISRVHAEFPEQSSHAAIPLTKIKACVQNYRGIKASSPDRVRVGGLDPAGKGNDETVHSVLEGTCMMRQDCFKKVLTPETVGWARALIEDADLEGLAIDEGYNPGIKDWLAFEKLPVSGVNFGGESPNPKFANMSTYMFYLLRAAIMNEEIGLLNDPILIYQIQSRKVDRRPDGKIILESKSKIHKSPDRLDALMLAWYMRCILIGSSLDVGDPGISDAARVDAEISRSSERPKSARAQQENMDEVSEIIEATDLGIGGDDGGMDAEDIPE